MEKDVKKLTKYIDKNDYYNLNSYLSENGIGNLKVGDWMNLQATKELADYIKREELVEPVVRIAGRITKEGREQDRIWLHPVLFFDFIGWTDVRWQVAVCEYVYENSGLDRVCELFDTKYSGEKAYLRYDGRTKDEVSTYLGERFGLKCLFEYPIADYRADMFVPDLNLVIELDGGEHSVSGDADRDRTMKSLLHNVYRFHETTSDNLAKLGDFIEKLKETPNNEKPLYGTDRDFPNPRP